jgi:hypothetical protein
MRTNKLGELAAIALVATICMCYAVMSRAQPIASAKDALAADLEFEGTPILKVEVTDGAVQTNTVPKQRVREYSVRIERNATGYVWASRNNVPLGRP